MSSIHPIYVIGIACGVALLGALLIFARARFTMKFISLDEAKRHGHLAKLGLALGCAYILMFGANVSFGGSGWSPFFALCTGIAWLVIAGSLIHKQWKLEAKAANAAERESADRDATDQDAEKPATRS